MTPTTFDKEFKRLTTEMVEVAFEYIGRNKEEVDGIYIYASMEKEIYFFNLFYKINNQLIKKDFANQLLVNKIDDSDERIDALLDFGIQALQDLSAVFKNDSREVPTLLKMVYLPKTSGFDCDVSYDLQFSNHKTNTNVDLFNNWYNEVKEQ